MSNEVPLKKCGAKTRQGTPCERSPARGRTRCRLHGGASPVGFAHPRYKHGVYSRYCIFGLLEKMNRDRERQGKALGRLVEKAECDAAEMYAKMQQADEYRCSLKRRGRPRKPLPEYDEFLYQFIRMRLYNRPTQGRPRKPKTPAATIEAGQAETGCTIR